ncbi:MAG: hypothetical protein HYX32_05760 [Actinobacteria bacterium]|nr:hypothetical protein [Actinomycetota bacterium]
MIDTATTIILDPLMDEDGARAMLRLCEDFAPGYGLYAVEESETAFAPELAQRYDAAANYVRSGGRFGRTGEPPRTLALRTNYLRESYAYGDEIVAPGIERFLHHERLIDAARQLYGRPVVEPAIAYANILLPGQELAVHTDVPEFRGANRKVVPQWLLVVMHHSGLFDAWRMPIATGISYFAPEGEQAEGGQLAFYPDAPDGPPSTFFATHNTAIVLDTDSVFHGVDRVGPVTVEPPELSPGNVLRFGAERRRWQLHPDESASSEVLEEFEWRDIRFSVSWKAYCFASDTERSTWRAHTDDLSLATILDRLVVDLVERGVLARGDARPPDRDLALLLIETYENFPPPSVEQPSVEQPSVDQPSVGQAGAGDVDLDGFDAAGA